MGRGIDSERFCYSKFWMLLDVWISLHLQSSNCLEKFSVIDGISILGFLQSGHGYPLYCFSHLFVPGSGWVRFFS